MPTPILMFPHPSLYVGDFKSRHVNWSYSKTSDDESLDFWATANNLGLLYDPKGPTSFSSQWWNVGTKLDLGFASVGQDNWQSDRRVLGEFLWPQHRPSLIMPLQFKVPAYSDLVKHWKFHKADRKCFCLLTGESVERLPLPDTTKIEKAYQEILGRACYLQLNNLSHMAVTKIMCHVGTKSARPFIVPTPKSQWGLTLIEPLRSCFHGSGRRGRNDVKKLSILSTSRTPATRHKAPSINLLASLDTPLACAPSQQTPSQLVRNVAQTTGSHESTRFINKQLPKLWKGQHLKETVYLALSGHRSLLPPSGTWSQESLWDWILFS